MAARRAARREEILGRVDAALAASGRARGDTTLVAVSKTVGVDEVVAAIPILIEVNGSGEETKGGFAPSELRAAFGELQSLCGIRIEGLMTMAPRGDKDRARAGFSPSFAVR